MSSIFSAGGMSDISIVRITRTILIILIIPITQKILPTTCITLFSERH